MDIDALIGAVLMPAAIGAGLLFVVRLARGRVPWAGSSTAPALALALAAVLASRHQSSGLFWPPRIALESFPWVVVCAALVAAVVREGAPSLGAVPQPRSGETAPGASAASAIAAAVTCVVALALLKLPATDAEARMAFTGMLVLGAAVAALSLRRPGPSGAIAMWGTAACAAGLSLAASLAKVSLVLGAFSATAAALAVLAAVQRPIAFGAPGAAVWVAVLGASAMLGMAYDEAGLPKAVWWLTGASPLAAGLSLVPRIARRPRAAAAVRAGAPIALALLAMVIALVSLARQSAHTPGSHEPSYDQYGLAGLR